MKFVILLSTFLFAQSLIAAPMAASWEKHIVPGASCGDGSPYAIFIQRNAGSHLNFKFNGGNACWDYETCFGKSPLTNMSTVEDLSGEDFFLHSPASPVADADRVVFSYCTGDVYVGNHQTIYVEKGKSATAYHYGRENIVKAMNYLDSIQFNLYDYSKVSIYGNSAGALGALYHITTIAPRFDLLTDKVLILDGPGLHFGKTFWDKFPAEQIEDFRHTLATFGMDLILTDGNLSGLVPSLCSMYFDWHVGVLQGSKDITMSWGFGELSPWEQEKMIFGPAGMWGYTENNTDNCVAFVPSTFKHTFLRKEKNTREKAKNGDRTEKTALGFATDILQRSEFENYK